MKTGIFYGSTTGTTKKIAYEIARQMNVTNADIHNVASTAPDVLGDYEMLLLGSSTWGNGELQEDWYDFLIGAKSLDLTGKKIALFGEGDETMSETFCDAMSKIKDAFSESGASFIGEYSSSPFNFNNSKSLIENGIMVGLSLDNVNHPNLTEKRISDWIKTLK